MSELYTKADVERAVREATKVGQQAERLDVLGAPALDVPHAHSHILASLTPVRLPVLTSCRGCVSCGDGAERCRCEHDAAPRMEPAFGPGPTGRCPTVDPDAAPPDWCPLRRPR